MKSATRAKLDSQTMGDSPCMPGARVTVRMIAGLTAFGHSQEMIAPAADA